MDNKKLTIYLAYTILLFAFLCVGCGGTYEYKVKEVSKFEYPEDKGTKLPGSVNLLVNAQPTHYHKWGFHSYKLDIKEGIEKQYQHFLSQCFSEGVSKNGKITVQVTVMESSIFPLGTLINDVRLSIRVRIYDEFMRKQKTVSVYGFGTDEDGNKALQKAVYNSFLQFLPVLEELFPGS